MGKELNLMELLKDAPIGTRLYSPICGECELEKVDNLVDVNVDYHNGIPLYTSKNQPKIIVGGVATGKSECFTKEGHYFSGEYGECLLFPSKDNRDWSTFKVEKEGLKVGDHIMSKVTGEVRVLIQKAQKDGNFTTKRVNAPFNACEIYIGGDKLSEYEKVSKFDPKWLKPFDRVLVRDGTTELWFASLFSHSINVNGEEYPYRICNRLKYKYCIPYNEETKHLVGTAGEEPNFYKIDYWL